MDSVAVADMSDNEAPLVTEAERKELMSNKGISEGIELLTGKTSPQQQDVPKASTQLATDWAAQVQEEEDERERLAEHAEDEAASDDDETDEDDNDDDSDDDSEEEPVLERGKHIETQRPSSGDMSSTLADMSDVIAALQHAVEAQDKVIQGLSKKVKKQGDEILELRSRSRIEKNQSAAALEALKVNLTKRVDDMSNSMSQVPPLVDRLLHSSNALLEKLPASTQETLQKVALTAAEEETVKTIKKQVAKQKEFKIPRWMQ